MFSSKHRLVFLEIPTTRSLIIGNLRIKFEKWHGNDQCDEAEFLFYLRLNQAINCWPSNDSVASAVFFLSTATFICLIPVSTPEFSIMETEAFSANEVSISDIEQELFTAEFYLRLLSIQSTNQALLSLSQSYHINQSISRSLYLKHAAVVGAIVSGYSVKLSVHLTCVITSFI